MHHNDHHSSGKFLSREVVLMGEHCERIHQLTIQLCQALLPLRAGYLDASHSHHEKMEVSSLTTSSEGSIWQLPKHQQHWNNTLLASPNDVLLINGNHHSGNQQILICNPDKIGSVMRRRETVTNVILIVMTEECQEVPSEYLDLHNAKEAPRLHISDINGIAHFLRNYFFIHPPAVLILAGGRSSRMGVDKSMVAYHGIPQLEYLTSIAEKMKMEAFVSVRDHSQIIPDGATAVSDVLNNFGPLGGICSAYMHNPQRTWLVVACDMPLVGIELMNEILLADATMHDVVCFKSPNSNLPEPLLSVWKPSALRFAWNCIANGIRCPRKVILRCNSLLLDCSQPDQLANANTPEDRVRLQKLLSSP